MLELSGGGTDTSGGEFGRAAGPPPAAFALASGTTRSAPARLHGQVEVQSATVNVATAHRDRRRDANRLTGGTLAGGGTRGDRHARVDGRQDGRPGRHARRAGRHARCSAASPRSTAAACSRTAGLIDVDGDRIAVRRLRARPRSARQHRHDRARPRAPATAPRSTSPLRNDGVVDGQGRRAAARATARPEPDTGTFKGTSAANRVVFAGARTLTGAVQLLGHRRDRRRPDGRAPGDTLTIAAPTAAVRPATLRGNVNVTGTLTWDGGRQAGAGHDDRGRPAAASVRRVDVTCGFASLGEGRRLVNQGLLRLEQGADLSTSARRARDHQHRPDRARRRRDDRLRLDHGHPRRRAACSTPARSRRSAAPAARFAARPRQRRR